MKLKYIVLSTVAALVVGCAAPQPDTTPKREIEEPQVNLAGYPPAFREGYLDGCNTARRNSDKIQDETRYKNDSMYAAGWRDGFDICSEKKYD
ncbi:MAG: hypothetical protein JSU95_14310 [Betaproteobacteria bacterium]|nr:MAG: hypothetical protein JSU95_14310 [Betaproteobacteria bacterium]